MSAGGLGAAGDSVYLCITAPAGSLKSQDGG